MPIPPIQCMRQRHRFVARLSASTSAIMVLPVVVNPDTASYSAAAGSGIEPSITNGSAPMSPSPNHVTPTTPSASLRWISSPAPLPRARSITVSKAANAVVHA
jgi:hypothetical protein